MMSREYKLAIAIILTVVFGFYGFNVALGGIMAGFMIHQLLPYSLGALLPFVICLVISLDQYGKLKKEKTKNE